MPVGNGSDRGRVPHEDESAEKELSADPSVVDNNIPLLRKRADFPRVFRHERTSANRHRETSRYVGGSNARWCGSRSCWRTVRRHRARIVKAAAKAAASREGRS
jgi:hypothetical protein